MDFAHQVIGVRDDDGAGPDGLSLSPIPAFPETGHGEQIAALPTNQERRLTAFHAVM
jgi:hypothetical protein